MNERKLTIIGEIFVRLQLLVVLWTVVAGVAGCAQPIAGGGVPSDAKVQIELDIFSGRPNPKWYLDAASVERLTTLLKAQRVTTSHDSAKVPALGFRGFQIEVREGARRRSYKVYRETLEADGKQFEDPGREVETLLRTTAPDQIRAEFPDIF